MEKIVVKDLPPMFRCIAEVFVCKEEELEKLDSMMGDGDLGLTMRKGFSALPDILSSSGEESLSKALMNAGMSLSSAVPSTMGFLMGAGLMGGGKAIKGKEEIDGEAFSEFLKGFSEGIMKRGKCGRGERTVLDAIESAYNKTKELLSGEREATLLSVALAAKEGAYEGAEATKRMEPRYGKAAVHKEKAIGIVDQGALAGCFLLEGICAFISKSCEEA